MKETPHECQTAEGTFLHLYYFHFCRLDRGDLHFDHLCLISDHEDNLKNEDDLKNKDNLARIISYHDTDLIELFHTMTQTW